MIIDSSYLSGSLQLPNIKATYPNSDILGNKALLQKFIDEHEVELMIYAIGNVDYAEFLAQFDPATGLLIGSPIAKWEKFINGETYVIDGETFRWKGLRYTEGTIKKSLIADYIYSKFLDSFSVTVSGAGGQRSRSQNSSAVNTIPQSVNAWNNFITKYQGGADDGGMASMFSSTLGTTQGIDWTTNRSEYFVSMLQYFEDKETDFPNVKTFLFKTKNSFGI